MASKELQTCIEMFRSRTMPENASIEEMREFMEAGFSHVPLAGDIRCEPVDAGGVVAEFIIAPESVEKRVIYYLHGGGYVMGSINTHREMASRLARAAKARVLLIKYRLAPENPFPAAVEDSLTGYQWLLSNGIEPGRLVISGESAGGGLTMATLVTLRDEGLPLPAAAVPISPWVDMEAMGESMVTRAELDPLLGRDILFKMANAYLGETERRTPLASPIYANLTGLPPLLILTGTSEVLYDDATRLAKKADGDGVSVVFEPWEEMIHMWHLLAAMLPEGQQAINRIGEFAIEHTND
jgi:acetyl esterase/lipase